MKVFAWPKGLGSSHLYTPAHRNRITEQWGGAVGQIAAQIPRAVCTIGGTVAGRYDQGAGRGADLDIILDQIEGGRSLVALWDSVGRRQSGWDSALAGLGDGELWRADGRVAGWAGEPADGATWRSVLVSGSWSTGSSALSVSGLLSGEVIPKGTWVRVGDVRYRVAATATEPDLGPAEIGGGRSFSLSFVEVYATEVDGGFEYQA